MKDKEKLDGYSMDLEEMNKEKLKNVFPECFAEGKLDIDKLISLCGDYIDNDFEKYKFEWNGKSECRRIAQAKSLGTLRPCIEESVNFNETDNLYIEGDNLEVLKLLQKSYFRKVKMIYIDPPYNTGNDFIYKDDFKDPIGKYKEVTKQTIKSNPERMGRYHTNWLNMMYPRLMLASNLLTDDGVIFISIDDNEVHNLRKLCDEVFGEENFRNEIIIKRGVKSVQSQFETWDKLGQGTEYILFYTKSANYRFLKQIKKLEYCKDGSWNNHWRGTDRPSMRYEILGLKPTTGQWRWSEERSKKAVDNYNKMIKILCKDNKTLINEDIDRYLSNFEEQIDLLRISKNDKLEHYIPSRDNELLNNLWSDLLIGNGKEVQKLFDKKIFDTPKLINVIMRMLNFINEDSIILDFFSGSATTAHAVMKLNAEDGGKRKFIMVQLPEKVDEKSEAYKDGYENICEIGKERIRRAGKKIKEEYGEKAENLDIGFKVLKLDTSNLVEWDSNYELDLTNFEDKLKNMLKGIKHDRTNMDVVYEIIIKMGIPIDVKVTYIETSKNKKVVYVVGEKELLICLEKDITAEDIEEMVSYKPSKIVCSEKGFKDDSSISNAHYILKDREIEFKLL